MLKISRCAMYSHVAQRSTGLPQPAVRFTLAHCFPLRLRRTLIVTSNCMVIKSVLLLLFYHKKETDDLSADHWAKHDTGQMRCATAVNGCWQCLREGRINKTVYLWLLLLFFGGVDLEWPLSACVKGIFNEYSRFSRIVLLAWWPPLPLICFGYIAVYRGKYFKQLAICLKIEFTAAIRGGPTAIVTEP